MSNRCAGPATMNQSADQQIIAAGAGVLREGAAHLEGAAARLGDDFVATVRALAAPDSFTMVVGAGKSGYIGRKFAASMLSTGHGAAFLHPTDALHGDIGIAEHASLAILLSHSGRTDELVTLIPAIKQFGVSAALITRRADCPLADYVDWVVETGVEAEAGIGRVAPTSSSTATLALCDALMMASLSLRGFSAQQFHRYHPGGALGQKLRKVSDVMLPLDRLAWLAPETPTAAVAGAITDSGLGFAIVSDRPRQAGVKAADVGFISDGDIRRAALAVDGLAGGTAADLMSTGPKAISADALAIEALRVMEQLAIIQLVCTDADGAIVGAVHIHSVVARELGLEPARGAAPA